jgi:hypothetical protein
MDFLGIPGLLEPDQVRDLLRSRQSERARKQSAAGAADPEPVLSREETTHEHLGRMRKELNALVAAWHHRTGQPHGVIHAALRRECTGPAAAVASADQLQERIDRIRHWATARQR